MPKDPASRPQKNDRIFLVMRVPKTIDPGPGPIIAEQIFATLSSLQEGQTWIDKLLRRPVETVSFEIIHKNQSIFFGVSVTRRMKPLLESQIYAHYPNVEIFEEEDYVKPLKRMAHTSLCLANLPVYPINR
jgi:hypothetical protein